MDRPCILQAGGGHPWYPVLSLPCLATLACPTNSALLISFRLSSDADKRKKDCDFWVTSSAHFCACPGQGCLALPRQTSRSSMAHTHHHHQVHEGGGQVLVCQLIPGSGPTPSGAGGPAGRPPCGSSAPPCGTQWPRRSHRASSGPRGGGLSSRCTWWPLSGVLACVPRCGVSSTCCLC